VYYEKEESKIIKEVDVNIEHNNTFIV